MEALEIVSFISNIALTLIGIYLVIVITRVYSLYRSLGFSRTVLTPFLLVGVLFAFSGATELLELLTGQLGVLIHVWIMLLTALFFAYGLRSYHILLMKAENKKELSKRNPHP